MIRTSSKFTASHSRLSLAATLVLLLVACGTEGAATPDAERTCENGLLAGDICTPWATCPAGTYVVGAPSGTADRSCAGCPSGTFSTTENVEACTPWSTCSPGSYVSSPGSAVADQESAPCTSGTYSSSANQAACVPFGTCAAGSAQAEGTPASEATCTTCEAGTHCAGGDAPKSPCGVGKNLDSWDHDGDPATACVLWTQCLPGNFVSVAGTATADRQCLPCPDGKISKGPNAAACVDPPVVAGIATGASHSCARFTDGSVQCWGRNIFGELGDGTSTGRPSPASVPGLSGVVDVTASSSGTCAVFADGFVRCWGNYNGPLLTLNPSALIQGLSDVVELRGGNSHYCARLSGGSVRCWGSNGRGQLGHGSSSSDSVPVPVTVSNLTGVTKLAVGNEHNCAVVTSGSVRCWGRNTAGQLGDGTTTNRTAPESAVPGVSGVIDIAAGANHTCAVLADHTVSCWGENSQGQLGDGTTTRKLSPTLVPGLSDVAAIVAGGQHTCALLADGTVHCWGYNNNGQLGDGTTTRKLTPIEVALEDVVELASQGNVNRTCARLADHSVRCWGNNGSGALGDGTTTHRNTPTPVVW